LTTFKLILRCLCIIFYVRAMVLLYTLITVIIMLVYLALLLIHLSSPQHRLIILSLTDPLLSGHAQAVGVAIMVYHNAAILI
jgi:hypothetical protein